MPQDSLSNADFAQQYGFNLAFLRSHPDINKVFKVAVKESWTPDEFVARLRGTAWFRKTSDSARKWTVLQATDPATAANRLRQRTANVEQMIGSLGITGANATNVARQSLLLGWDDAELQKHLAKSWEYNPDKTYGGTAGSTIAALKKTAADYLVPVSDNVIEKWSQRVIAGTAKPQDYENWARNQAKAMMPALNDQLDAGMTARELIDPYAQMAEKVLGISADSIDFTQAKWRQAVDVVDPKTNQRSMMTFSDWERTMKKDSRYGYDTTSNAREEAAGLVTRLAKMFGGG